MPIQWPFKAVFLSILSGFEYFNVKWGYLDSISMQCNKWQKNGSQWLKIAIEIALSFALYSRIYGIQNSKQGHDKRYDSKQFFKESGSGIQRSITRLFDHPFRDYDLESNIYDF